MAHLFKLKVTETDFTRSKETKEAIPGLNTWMRAYDPTKHEPDDFSYRENLLLIVRQPLDPRNGAGIDEVDKSLRVYYALRDATEEGTLRLEDADWEHLKALLRSRQWGLAAPWIRQMVSDVEGAVLAPIPKSTEEAA